MTKLEKIVEREMLATWPCRLEPLSACGQKDSGWHHTGCLSIDERAAVRGSLLNVARAAVEEAAHACERIEVLSYHCTEAVALRSAASKIRALAAPSAGKGERCTCPPDGPSFDCPVHRNHPEAITR